jgi:hypothetical protein
MNAAELGAKFNELKQVAREIGDDAGVEVVDALCDLLVRFGERSTTSVVTKLHALKPPRAAAVKKQAKPRAPRVPKEPKETGPQVASYISELQSTSDPILIASIVARIRADKVIAKPEAVEIAKGLGYKVTSKTAKGAALDMIESAAAEKKRDKETGERINQGA